MSSPHEKYTRRLSTIGSSAAQLKQKDSTFASLKLIVGIATIVAAVWLIKYRPAQSFVLLIPVALFIALAVWHERILRSLKNSRRLEAYYQRGIERIENRWASDNTAETGERFLESSHPYTRDLDIFGAGSLFQLLCTARTRSGEETLADWLQSAAEIPEILTRQEAVQQLTARLDFRERLALAGEEMRAGAHPEQLLAWAEGKSQFNRTAIRTTAISLAVLWLASLAAWWAWDWAAIAIAISILNFAVNYRLRGRLHAAAAGVDGAHHDLALLAAILGIIEGEAVSAEKFSGLQAHLVHCGTPASRAIASLTRRVEWLESNDNWFVKILDPFVFYTSHFVIAIDAWRSHYGNCIREWLAVTGEVEALSSIAAYAYEHPDDTFPVMLEDGPHFSAEAIAHPLLARDSAIANDLRLDTDLQLLVISGPNMAGKSTFIRSIGINAVLAQAGAPVCARTMTLSPLQVAASICILDSLQGGLSRFYAEISRLKLIDELNQKEKAVLFLLDELLSGTNSLDRRIGTESFVKGLIARGAIGLVTTHDLALAEIAERIGARAANYHFSDTFTDGRLHFDYKLTPGVVQTTNALLLMRSIGLDV